MTFLTLNHSLAFVLVRPALMVRSFILIFFLRWISIEIHFSEIEMLRERHEILPELYYSVVFISV